MAYQSGFCITKHHHNCPISPTYDNKTYFCECQCHHENQKDLEATPVLEEKENMSKTQNKTTDVIFEAAIRSIKAGNEQVAIKALAGIAAEVKGVTYANAIRNYQIKIRELAEAETWLTNENQTLALELIQGEVPTVKLRLDTTSSAVVAE